MRSQGNRYEIGILGGKGMLGSDLVKHLGKKHIVESITKENYKKKLGTYYKVLINANGNSSRFWANQNPMDDFLASTVSVYKSIFDFPSELYIYISSSDVYENHTGVQYTKEEEEINPKNLQPYGLHKYLGELIVKRHKEKFLILRCSMILGSNFKKGPLYDIIHHNPLFITLSSKLQLITTQAIFQIIETLLKKSVVNESLNIGGIDSFTFTKIQKYFDKKIQVSAKAETQIYEMNVEKIRHLYPRLKTSEEYLQEFLKQLQTNER